MYDNDKSFKLNVRIHDDAIIYIEWTKVYNESHGSLNDGISHCPLEFITFVKVDYPESRILNMANC